MLNIKIPPGRRPGKVLRRLAPEGFGQDFSALVESLDYEVSCLTDPSEIDQALISCRSCQSRAGARELYIDFWGLITEVTMIGLVDQDGVFVARCLINEARKSFAPIYGDKHYLLEARLRFSGFRKGDILDRSLDEVEALVRKIRPPRTLPPTWRDRPPKFPPEIRRETRQLPQMPYRIWARGSLRLSPEMGAYKASLRNFRRLSRKYGVHVDATGFSFWHTQNVPKKEVIWSQGWEGEACSTSLYIDDFRLFIKVPEVVFGAGYYLAATAPAPAPATVEQENTIEDLEEYFALQI